jgi:hypothetical protein
MKKGLAGARGKLEETVSGLLNYRIPRLVPLGGQATTYVYFLVSLSIIINARLVVYIYSAYSALSIGD